MNQLTEQEIMKEMLSQTKTIAVIGLSDKEYRTSFQIAKAMQQAGYRIIPVNPHVQEVLGEKAYASIKDVKEPFELINIFRRSTYLKGLASDMINTDAKYIWMQQGVADQEVYEKLIAHDKKVIMNQCIKVAHAVLM